MHHKNLNRDDMKETMTVIPYLDENYRSFRHKSGLRVIFSEKNFTASFAILGVGFGSAYEKAVIDGKNVDLPGGTAHFLEHKMFENPDGEDTFFKFSRVGASANAYTSTDKTCYLFSAANAPEEALAILLDSVFSPFFTKKNVAKEKPIIKEELKMYRDDPSDKLYHRLLCGMYETSAVRNDICGNVTSVERITAETLYKAYDLFYTPDNMVLSLSGKFDIKKVKTLLDCYLPTDRKKSYKTVTLPTDKDPTVVFRRNVTLKDDIATPIFAIGVKAGEFFYSSKAQLKRFYMLNILAHVLFSGSGKFVSSLMTDNIIPDAPDYEIVHNRISSHIIFATGAYRPKELKKRFFARIKELRETGVTEEEFIRGKRILYADFTDNFNSTEECATNYMSDALENLKTEDVTEVISHLTLAELNLFAKKLLLPSSVTCAVSYPKTHTERTDI